MHLFLLLTALSIAFLVRVISQFNCFNDRKHSKHWGISLFFFAFPPLVLLMTCITIILMGYHGEMWGIKASKFSYDLALSYIFISVIYLVKNFIDLYRLHQLTKQYSSQYIGNKKVKIIETSFPYAAQIGFWRSQLVVSQGLMDLLSEEHLQAVIAHETAHETYKDPFFFFWLSYIERLTFWLPNNKKLWHNLLLLRELRADKTASNTVDFLLIAESLVQVTSATIKQKQPFTGLALECPFNDSRLEERIDNLLTENNTVGFSWSHLLWLIIVFVPCIFIPFHIAC